MKTSYPDGISMSKLVAVGLYFPFLFQFSNMTNLGHCVLFSSVLIPINVSFISYILLYTDNKNSWCSTTVSLVNILENKINLLTKQMTS